MPEITEAELESYKAAASELEKANKQIETLKGENYTYREEKRTLKASLDTAQGVISDRDKLLEAKDAELTTIKTESEKIASENKNVTKKANLAPLLAKAGIVDEKALEIAYSKLDTVEADFEVAVTNLVKDYSFLAGKQKVSLPDTGKSFTKDAPVNEENLLAAGLALKLGNK
ncbi:hypothetical protein Q0M94_19225 (plasmid) [Deinococcus radiomollis]|uniref:hypothetical protein n=1 Tax=Deinococcus radiomollis TaxID=468916 RepID=UPI0038925DEF